MRQNGFQGRVVILTQEPDPPYDRPKLSKAMSSTGQDLRLRPKEFYDEADIEVLTGAKVVRVDTASKKIHHTVDGGEKEAVMDYTKLVLATGSTPRRPQVPGGDLENVFVLRTPADGNAIVEAGKGKDVVVIGSSFIGMEVAAHMADKAKSVTVVGTSAIPFERSLGEKVGRYLQSMHDTKGIKFAMPEGVAEIAGTGGKATEVVLKSGKRLPADVVVAGIGVIPNTAFLRDSEIALTDRGFIKVNEFMATSSDDVWAAGDVVSFPLFIADDTHVNIGHYQVLHERWQPAFGQLMTSLKLAALHGAGEKRRPEPGGEEHSHQIRALLLDDDVRQEPEVLRVRRWLRRRRDRRRLRRRHFCCLLLQRRQGAGCRHRRKRSDRRTVCKLLAQRKDAGKVHRGQQARVDVQDVVTSYYKVTQREIKFRVFPLTLCIRVSIRRDPNTHANSSIPLAYS